MTSVAVEVVLHGAIKIAEYTAAVWITILKVPLSHHKGLFTGGEEEAGIEAAIEKKKFALSCLN